MIKNLYVLTVLAVLTSCFAVKAQVWWPEKGCVVDSDGNCLPNTLLTAVPFLRINPDARSGGMGDAGIGISADANSMHYNASKLAFVENDLSVSATYTPWLRQLGLQDVYLAYLSGYKKINDLQSLGFAIRFFSLGDIPFTDIDGNGIGTGRPREMDISFAYARKLGENFSAALTAKYIYSNLAAGQQLDPTTDIFIGNAFATDLSLTYVAPINLGDYGSDLTIGLAISNLGSKITYTRNINRDYIPANLGIGAAWKIDVDDYNSFTIALDLNKLLVPTPVPAEDTESYDTDGNGVPDYKEKSIFEAALESFNDASGGGSEEFNEIYYSAGLEYWYDNQFAVRAGYYYEHPLKGDRQFLTVGIGLKYNVFGMNLSYLVPTSNRRGPLDNTLRFGFNYDFGGVAVN
ncbi:type IX secretion system outer membrane channel protein PorV [Portibacter marinus]|uniref:type IX secretion system outer membrane channel protein PorV n=1 Tax=Portibacter marinus TaxID=2898660 RepID=UPI001F430F3E|nr:type IX secretion system outer membrane channel protein PorV [Portibacter marinus]